MVLPRRAPAAAAAAAGLLMLVLGVARTGAVQVGGYLSEADIQRFGAIGKGGWSKSPRRRAQGRRLPAVLLDWA